MYELSVSLKAFVVWIHVAECSNVTVYNVLYEVWLVDMLQML